jgi:hypothetical protein
MRRKLKMDSPISKSKKSFGKDLQRAPLQSPELATGSEIPKA